MLYFLARFVANIVAETYFRELLKEVDEGVFGKNYVTIDHENVVNFTAKGLFGDFIACFGAIVTANESEFSFEIAAI